MTAPLVRARGLRKEFAVGGGVLRAPRRLAAVDGVDLDVWPGETLAIVGESGCGKSTLARLLMRLAAPTAGSIAFDGREIAALQGAALTALRRDVQFVFQDPFGSLNPRLTVARLVAEPIEAHRPGLTAAARRAEVARLLAEVGLRPAHMDRFPHEFSGGQRQRIGIARALAAGPRLLIGDEPLSALDVSVQAQVVNLLADLKARRGLTLIVIAHDLAVVRQMADRIAVMYLGRVVETGPADALFARPRHPYTRALLAAVPGRRPPDAPGPAPLAGETPSPLAPPSGCHFRTRCPHAAPECADRRPPLVPTGTGTEAACLRLHAVPDAPPVLAGMPPPTRGAASRLALYRDALARRGTAGAPPFDPAQQETTP